MLITVNGTSHNTAATSLTELVAEVTSSTSTDGVAVAVDGAVVPRSQWDTPLTEGSEVDILTAVQGG